MKTKARERCVEEVSQTSRPEVYCLGVEESTIRWVTVGLLAAALFSSCMSCSKPEAEVPAPIDEKTVEYSLRSEFPDLVNWQMPADAGSEFAKTQRPLLLYFTDERCGLCECLQVAVLSVEQHANLINRYFTPVKVEGDSGVYRALRQRFEVRGTPVLIVVSSEGDEMGRLVGWKDAETTVSFLMKFAHVH